MSIYGKCARVFCIGCTNQLRNRSRWETLRSTRITQIDNDFHRFFVVLWSRHHREFISKHLWKSIKIRVIRVPKMAVNAYEKRYKSRRVSKGWDVLSFFAIDKRVNSHQLKSGNANDWQLGGELVECAVLYLRFAIRQFFYWRCPWSHPLSSIR